MARRFAADWTPTLIGIIGTLVASSAKQHEHDFSETTPLGIDAESTEPGRIVRANADFEKHQHDIDHLILNAYA